ncbi:hypothetical protein [Filifactor alocis]|nr:hypothetical protein [Filifactor alocis]
MYRKRLIYCMFAVFMIILFCSCQKNYKYGNNELDSSDSENKPYLEIVGAKYIDKKDKSKGVINLYCLYSIEEDKTIMKEELLPAKGYPVSCLDPNTKKIYYSASAGDDDYENLFVYDRSDKSNNQLTNEKMLYNDIFFAENKLLANVATTGKNVTQPAVIDLNDFKFKYLDENDDDTWIYSFSYSSKTKDLLCLTCSDSGMRTDKVTRVTHIRPKKICSMDLDFSNRKVLFETDKYEILETRRLNKDKVIMVYEDSMLFSDRKIKIIDVVSKKEFDVEIEDLTVGSIYPDRTGENIYIWGEKSGQFAIFEYSLKDKKIIKTLTKKELFGDENISIIDFKYSMLNM